MPRMLEKEELIKSVFEPSRFDRFWLDTLHPLDGSALVSLPKGISQCDVQVVYIPVERQPVQKTAKDRLHALMARTPKQHGKPYQFSRKDAYEEDLA